jgi:hypothetical protein
LELVGELVLVPSLVISLITLERVWQSVLELVLSKD